jgi:hypothetical protein
LDQILPHKHRISAEAPGGNPGGNLHSQNQRPFRWNGCASWRWSAVPDFTPEDNLLCLRRRKLAELISDPTLRPYNVFGPPIYARQTPQDFPALSDTVPGLPVPGVVVPEVAEPRAVDPGTRESVPLVSDLPLTLSVGSPSLLEKKRNQGYWNPVPRVPVESLPRVLPVRVAGGAEKSLTGARSVYSFRL